MSWFDSQLQLLQYCHWKLRKLRLTVSLTKFASGLSAGVKCYHLFTFRSQIVVFIAFLNRSCWAKKECHLSLLDRTKIDQAKNQRSFTSFVYKLLTKFSEVLSQFFQIGNSFRLLLDQDRSGMCIGQHNNNTTSGFGENLILHVLR
jgi:hypothetical protein